MTEDNNSLGNIGQSSPIVQHEYCGNCEKQGLRHGPGCQVWTREYHQKYEGCFLYDNLHGGGVYVIKSNKTRVICNGKFYDNDLEGYAEIISAKGTFEGLFRCNRRFGPGINTNIDGSQDVGLWEDDHLTRLSRSVKREWVPRFARTQTAKAYLLKYRRLIPIVQHTKDIAKEILTELKASKEILKNSEKLYNIYARNRKSLFFNKTKYDDIYFSAKDCSIEVALSNQVVQDGVEQPECECCCVASNELCADEIQEEIRRIDRDLYKLREKIDKIDIETTHPIFTGSYVNVNEKQDEQIYEYDQSEYHLTNYKNEEQMLINLQNGLRKRLALPRRKVLPAASLTKRVKVTDLLAWNNGKTSALMLKHCFLHRDTETYVHFDVAKLLSGERDKFGETGQHETHCVEFLAKCSQGKDEEVAYLLMKHDLNPDVSDVMGNTGIMFAAARDRLPVIRTLVNNGANVDSFNDECLTPLNLCVCRYLAEQNKVSDWGRAFLPNEAQEIATTQSRDAAEKVQLKPGTNKEWRQRTSFAKLQQPKQELDSGTFYTEEAQRSHHKSLFGDDFLLKCPSFAETSGSFQMPYLDDADPTQLYIFNRECVKPPQPPQAKKKVAKTPKLKKPKKSKKIVEEEKEISALEYTTPLVTDSLVPIEHTINQLLDFGADTNLAQVPLPTITLSIFTKSPSIVEQLLTHKANPNTRATDDNMTPLHFVVSLPPSKENVDICKLLLCHSANPNYRTSRSHWNSEKDAILGKDVQNVRNDGKTPLHLLCMRYDFTLDKNNYLHDLAATLIQNRSNVYATYLGHTPLSLAILRGNSGLVDAILSTNVVDPNQPLGKGMGVPLTVLILKRYKDIVPPDLCCEIYDLLVSHFANPFREVCEFGNVVEFMEEEHKVVPKTSKSNVKKKSKVTKDKKRKTSKKSDDNDSKHNERAKPKKEKTKKSKKPKGQDIVKEHLLECARTVLFRRIQCQATKHMYDIIDENVPMDGMEGLARLVTPEEVATYTNLLIHNGQISCDTFNFETLYALLNFVIEANDPQEEKRKNTTESAESSKSERRSTKIILDILKTIDVQPEAEENATRNPVLDSDNPELYSVCLHCCKKTDKMLMACPECEMAYFCSEACNLANTQLNRFHKCSTPFYDNERSLAEERVADGRPWKLPTNLERKFNMVEIRKRERMQREQAEKRMRGSKQKRKQQGEKKSRNKFKEFFERTINKNEEEEQQRSTSTREGSTTETEIAQADIATLLREDEYQSQEVYGEKSQSETLLQLVYTNSMVLNADVSGTQMPSGEDTDKTRTDMDTETKTEHSDDLTAKVKETASLKKIDSFESLTSLHEEAIEQTESEEIIHLSESTEKRRKKKHAKDISGKSSKRSKTSTQDSKTSLTESSRSTRRMDGKDGSQKSFRKSKSSPHSGESLLTDSDTSTRRNKRDCSQRSLKHSKPSTKSSKPTITERSTSVSQKGGRSTSQKRSKKSKSTSRGGRSTSREHKKTIQEQQGEHMHRLGSKQSEKHMSKRKVEGGSKEKEEAKQKLQEKQKRKQQEEQRRTRFVDKGLQVSKSLAKEVEKGTSIISPRSQKSLEPVSTGGPKLISQRLIEDLRKYFPNVDVSRIILPYACFSGGQLYYRFNEPGPIFHCTYSSM